MDKKTLSSKQKSRLRQELMLDQSLEDDTSLAWLDQLETVDWKLVSKDQKTELIRDLVMGAIEDTFRLRSIDKIEDLKEFFTQPISINEQNYPSLFFVYASYLGHDQSWINLATKHSLSQIQKSLESSTVRSAASKRSLSSRRTSTPVINNIPHQASLSFLR